MKQTVLQKAVRSLFVPIALGLSLPALAASDKAQREGTQASSGARNASATKQQAQSLRNIRASTLVDAEITDMAGRDIGKVQDLIVQMNSGQVHYAAVTLGGLDGVSGDRIYAVPVRELKRGTKEDKVVLDTTVQRVKQMRFWEKDRWETAFDDRGDRRQPASEVGRETRQAANEARREVREERREARQADRSQAREERREARAEQREANQGRSSAGSGAPIAGSNTFRASKLIGQNVESPTGENLGELKDLVIDANGQKVRYAVLSFDPGILSAERNHAFPLNKFVVPRSGRRDGDVDKLVLNASKEQLKDLRGFSDNNWPDFNDRTYLGDLDRRIAPWPGDRGASTGASGKRDGGSVERNQPTRDKTTNR